MKETEESGEMPPARDPEIRVCHNGPYRVSGGVPLAVQRIVLDADGFAAD